MGIKGKFAGVEDATTSGGGVYFLDGIYEIEVERCFMMQSRKKDDLFIVECKILESDNDERRVGTHASWVVNLKHDASLGHIKSFVGAANGIHPENEKDKLNESVTEEVCELAVDDSNPLAGTRLALEATTIKTKAGGDFTLHRWSPVA